VMEWFSTESFLIGYFVGIGSMIAVRAMLQ